MDVGAAGERFDQARVVREMREHPQLDLRVVGRQQPAAFVGDERTAHLPTIGCAHGDVLEIRVLARDATGRRVGLLEGGVDAPVVVNERRQCVGVRAAELLDLAVTQQVFDDRVLVGHLLERVGVGRRAGLRLLDRRQAELLEEDLAQLGRGVHVELHPGVGLDLSDEVLAALGQLGAQSLEELAIDLDAGVLHPRQHAHERPLDALVEVGELARLQRLGERAGEAAHGQRAPSRLVDAGLAVEVEVERALLGVG